MMRIPKAGSPKVAASERRSPDAARNQRLTSALTAEMRKRGWEPESWEIDGAVHARIYNVPAYSEDPTDAESTVAARDPFFQQLAFWTLAEMIANNVEELDSDIPDIEREKKDSTFGLWDATRELGNIIEEISDPMLQARLYYGLTRFASFAAKCANLDSQSDLPRLRKNAVGATLTAQRRAKAEKRHAELSGFLLSTPQVADALSEPDLSKRYVRIRRWLAKHRPEMFDDSNRRTGGRDLKSVLHAIGKKRRKRA